MSAPALPGSPRGAPPVDLRLVAPETRYEIDDGRIHYVSPSDEPHGTRHSKVSALVEAHAADDYDVASDMLTRTSEVDDIAPDVSVFPIERDAQTGGRRIEELAFEVVSTERLAAAAKKAQKLEARGVRRVFALDVARQRAFEWSSELGTWQVLSLAGVIDDRALAVPLPIAPLVQAAKADDAVARALIAKRNPAIVAAVLQGEVKGRAIALITLIEARGLVLSAAARARIMGCEDTEQVEAWLRRVLEAASVEQILDG